LPEPASHVGGLRFFAFPARQLHSIDRHDQFIPRRRESGFGKSTGSESASRSPTNLKSFEPRVGQNGIEATLQFAILPPDRSPQLSLKPLDRLLGVTAVRVVRYTLACVHRIAEAADGGQKSRKSEWLRRAGDREKIPGSFSGRGNGRIARPRFCCAWTGPR
jgi:hypothetical protein